MNTLRLLFSSFVLFFTALSHADEIRPGYLSITEETERHYQVVLKLPMKGNKILSLYPTYPNDCTAILNHNFQDGRASTQYWKLNCQDSLQGRSISIPNLQTSSTDIYLRYKDLQSEYHYRLSANHSEQTLAASKGNIWTTYILLGIEHILLGWDHLCFVLLLMFLLNSRKQLLLAVTGFTVSHSITLVLSTLNWVNLPITSVEILIAASIVFIAREVLINNKKVSLTVRHPLTITALFGLFHGFGFASVLQDIGLPEQSIPQALLSFNIGVEIGQLIFIAFIILIQKVIFKFIKAKTFIQYTSGVIGILASYWFLERCGQLMGG